MTEPRFMLRFPRICAVRSCDTMMVTGSLVEVVDGAIVCGPCWRTPTPVKPAAGFVMPALAADPRRLQGDSA
jgi:hypothetical protein